MTTIKIRRRVNRKIGPVLNKVMNTLEALDYEQSYGHIIAEKSKIRKDQVYVSLSRLEKYGYLTSVYENRGIGDKVQVRRYKITESGKLAYAIAKAYYENKNDN